MARISERLIPALRSAFPDSSFRVGSPPEPLVVFPAAHSEVGEAWIYDHVDDTTVPVYEITHGHFGTDDPDLSEEEAARTTVEQVVEFLRQLFADRVLLWKSADRGAGGWRVLGNNSQTETFRPGAPTDAGTRALTYLWTGPVNQSSGLE